MTEAKSEPRKAASDSRDYLISELARVDDFLDMADRLADGGEDGGFGLELLPAGTASAAIL